MHELSRDLMLRFVENPVNGPGFNDPAGLHHGHLIAHLSHDSHVVGHEEDSDWSTTSNLPEQFENSGLNRDIQRRCGFIEHQEIGLRDDGSRNGDALTLAT